MLPLESVGSLAAGHVSRVRRSIHRRLAERPATAMVDQRRVDRVLTQTASCRHRPVEERCASAVGERLGATHVVAGALGGLGKTFLIQLKLVDVTRGSAIRTLEESHFGGPAGLEATVEKEVDRLVLERQERRPWYGRWWVWTIVGGMVATAVIVPIVVHKDDPYEEWELP